MATATYLDISQATLPVIITKASTLSANARHDNKDKNLTPVSHRAQKGTSTQPLERTETSTASQWADLIRTNLQSLANPKEPLNTTCLAAPRRRHADQASNPLAIEIASLLYPTVNTYSSISAVIKYEKDIVSLRKAILAQQKAEEMARVEARLHPPWKGRVLAQGPWDEVGDPLELTGAPALPMPVTISDEESLMGFFGYLGEGRGFEGWSEGFQTGKETYYGVEVREFEKGILYEDGRMDLCKMALGPPNISELMTSLEGNTFVRHFLLGNNMIGPVGARMISDFVLSYPNRIETWYLAGNCIDIRGFERLVAAWTTSSAITNVWLKRNPLGPDAATALYMLVTKTANLRTLDLDQTELGDGGVAQLFNQLASHEAVLSLRHLYLNATGIGESACKALASYLSSPNCELESLYMSCNPVGDAGAMALAYGLKRSKSLLRLSITSCGLKTFGTKHLLEALNGHPRLMTLNMGQNYASEDLGARYNWLEDGVGPLVTSLVRSCRSLRTLELGTTGMTLAALSELAVEIANVETLVVFNAKSTYGKIHPELKAKLNERVKENIKQLYGGMDVATFDAEEKRWLISPKDVRLIDSAYRNRDAGLARRGMLRLKKVWEDDLETVEGVMHADV